MMIDDVTMLTRLVLAVVLGGIIGFERQHRGKTAGLRTHILVCLGSCLTAVLSVNMYAAVQGLTNADPARLGAQVISGIGFLGAGAIMKEGPTVKGLTTAASLWVVATVGLATGVGALTSAVATTVLIAIVLEVFPIIDRRNSCRVPSLVQLSIRSQDFPGQIGRVGSCLRALGVDILQIQIEECEKGIILIPLTIQLPETQKLEQIMAALTKIEGVLGIM
ncbi:putative Mg2+ transporter-C (MgtC) family protein [Anaerospora hongkongensis]|uniref:Putative Mg2+ transporter-C (MgtC) family protein n=2 Tax=Anaerospora hongkongensis TaxID=244830 RepID=A0A4R1Q8X0_9FIRM|nr:MgtC/SapB family protein [Anaerospora hongkongensis]TCL38175.1 putative Mg2+ transporter-C (MgtC) family protein [Anaerospora hongkongensis]